jgi:hypothetical protein
MDGTILYIANTTSCYKHESKIMRRKIEKSFSKYIQMVGTYFLQLHERIRYRYIVSNLPVLQ